MLRGVPTGALAGLVLGAVVGFLWAQETKRQLPSAVNTRFSGGKVTVTVDAGLAAAQGLRGIVN